MALPIFDKTTPSGKSLRTWVQAGIGLTTFLLGIVAIPGVYQTLSQDPLLAGGSLVTWIAVITYIHNALGRAWDYLNSPYQG